MKKDLDSDGQLSPRDDDGTSPMLRQRQSKILPLLGNHRSGSKIINPLAPNPGVNNMLAYTARRVGVSFFGFLQPFERRILSLVCKDMERAVGVHLARERKQILEELRVDHRDLRGEVAAMWKQRFHFAECCFWTLVLV